MALKSKHSTLGVAALISLATAQGWNVIEPPLSNHTKHAYATKPLCQACSDVRRPETGRNNPSRASIEQCFCTATASKCLTLWWIITAIFLLAQTKSSPDRLGVYDDYGRQLTNPYTGVLPVPTDREPIRCRPLRLGNKSHQCTQSPQSPVFTA